MPKKFKKDYGKSSQVPSHLHNPQQSRSDPLSVNDRIEWLRRTQAEGSNTARKLQNLRDQAQSHRSVPPALGALLGIPKSAPPRPRVKPGGRLRLPGGARVAGPAPPRSWLSDTISVASRRADVLASSSGSWASRNSTAPLSRFLTLTQHAVIVPGSLTHCALRSLTAAWDDIDGAHVELVRYLPRRAHAALPSYLIAYGPGRRLLPSDLETLACQQDENNCLDLAGQIGRSVPLKRLASVLRSQTIHDTAPLDSWDENISWPMNRLSMATSPSLGFSLTKLSLSHPPGTVSWMELLSLTAQTPNLTHLSLAYWPYPAWTSRDVDHMTEYETATHSPSKAYLATLRPRTKEEAIEARSVLRRLSSYTRNLRWLDIEGCDDWWLDALSSPDSSVHATSSDISDTAWEDNEITPSVGSAHGVDWLLCWSNITHVRMTQKRTVLDWPYGLPKHLYADTPSLHEDQENRDRLCRMQIAEREASKLGFPYQDCDYYMDRRILSAITSPPPRTHSSEEYHIWLDRELKARELARWCVRARRKAGGGRTDLLTVDFGWPTCPVDYVGLMTRPASDRYF